MHTRAQLSARTAVASTPGFGGKCTAKSCFHSGGLPLRAMSPQSTSGTKPSKRQSVMHGCEAKLCIGFIQLKQKQESKGADFRVVDCRGVVVPMDRAKPCSRQELPYTIWNTCPLCMCGLMPVFVAACLQRPDRSLGGRRVLPSLLEKIMKGHEGPGSWDLVFWVSVLRVQRSSRSSGTGLARLCNRGSVSQGAWQEVQVAWPLSSAAVDASPCGYGPGCWS